MQIKRDLIAVMGLEEFADQHGLTLVVKERRLPEDSTKRFYAYFEDGELRQGGLLSGRYGSGASEEGAIQEYADCISMGNLVIDADGPGRREIVVPRLRWGKRAKDGL